MKNALPAAGLLALLFAVACASLPFGRHDGVVLVDARHPPCPVLVPTNASPGELQAARKLADYLARLGGAPFPVLPATNPLPARAVWIGLTRPDPAREEAFSIRRSNGVVRIESPALQGLHYGLYAFLEEELGCRWWSGTEETVPASPTLRAAVRDRVEAPAMPFHSILSQEAMRPANDFPLKRRTVSPEKFDGSHTLCPYLKKASELHPEFLPMNKEGKREFNNLHMCYTAPGMAEALADALDARIKATGADLARTIYMAGMGDWYGGMCECEPCRAIYAEEAWTDPDGTVKPAYMATLLRMINKTAEILDARHPGVRIGTAAYMSLEAPPARTVPRANVHIWMPHLRHCIVHGLDECEKNRNFMLNLRRWLEIAPGRVSIWDYGVNFSNFMTAFPSLRSIARNIRLYHEWGCHGVMIQGNYVSTGGDLVALKNDVWSRLLWDPTLDPDRLLESFCLGYYGPAGRDMIAYVNALEQSVRSPVAIHLNEFESAFTNTYLKPAKIKELEAILDRAARRAKGRHPFERRVREARVGVESALLWREGPLEERGDRLVRTDLGGDSWDRALALLADCREASPSEWGTGRSYRMGFLTWHGGPLVTLTNGPLEVKLAPVLGGRIRQITWNGQFLLHTPRADRKENANGGGSVEILSPGAAFFLPTGAVTAAACTLRGELGIGHWSPNTKQVALKTVELTGPRSLRVSGAVRRTARDESDTIASRIATEYAAPDPALVSLERRDAAGAWHSFPVPSGKPDPKTAPTNLPPCTAWRVLLKDKGLAVLDTCDSPAPASGRAWHDPARGTLVTETVVPPRPVPLEGETPYLSRTVEIQPAP